jgi:hypothetical protein
MPIEAIPLGQEVLALAAKLTGDPTVLPLAGLVIFTPANAEIVVNTKRDVRTCFLIKNSSPSEKFGNRGACLGHQAEVWEKEGPHRIRRDTLNYSSPAHDA